MNIKIAREFIKQNRLNIFKDIFNESIFRFKNFDSFLMSRKKDYKLSKGNVACIMCVYDEQIISPIALESSKDFVSRYIVVDKNGRTIEVLKELKDKWNLDIEFYIKPNLSLRESRYFAVKKINEDWILIQDGDEVFHTDGLNSIFNLRKWMNRPNIYICAKMVVLMRDFKHTSRYRQIQPPHKFLYHNNGTIGLPDINEDLPNINGWRIILPYIFKWNCKIKPLSRIMSQFKRKISYEELNKLLEESIIKYDVNRWGYYPKVIRERFKNEY